MSIKKFITEIIANKKLLRIIQIPLIISVEIN